MIKFIYLRYFFKIIKSLLYKDLTDIRRISALFEQYIRARALHPRSYERSLIVMITAGNDT